MCLPCGAARPAPVRGGHPAPWQATLALDSERLRGATLAGLRAPHPRAGATRPPRPPARDSCPWTLKGTGERMAGGVSMPDQARTSHSWLAGHVLPGVHRPPACLAGWSGGARRPPAGDREGASGPTRTRMASLCYAAAPYPRVGAARQGLSSLDPEGNWDATLAGLRAPHPRSWPGTFVPEPCRKLGRDLGGTARPTPARMGRAAPRA